MEGHSYFDLRLTPNRSLGRKQFQLLMVAFAGIALLGVVRFLVLGAWPIALFIGFDVLLLYLAFKLNYRSGRQYETLRLDRQSLMVRQVNSAGREKCARFNPHWVRVRLEPIPDGDNRLWLSGEGRDISVGRFLSPGERAEVGEVIRDGLARYLSRSSPSPSTSAIP